jgi:hypothetical protein
MKLKSVIILSILLNGLVAQFSFGQNASFVFRHSSFVNDTPLNLAMRGSFPSREGKWSEANTGVCAVKLEMRVSNDTIPKNDTTKKHSPRRAAIYSAVLPGLGQVYNKQYWKVPVIYAGGAVAGYLIYYNYSVYNNLHKAFRYRKDSLPDTNREKFTVKTISGNLNVDLENFSDGEVLDLQNTYRRDLDLSVLLAFGIYALNIVDAVVYGHLYDFDVSDDLSLRLQPDFNYVRNTSTGSVQAQAKPNMQLSLTYRF